MNIEDLKKLSVQDALREAAKFTGVDASVLEGVWNAESAKGAKMLSPAGARGHFGLMPKTQALFEKKLGVKVNPDDFHESLYLAAHHLKEDLQREGGNVVAALRAYNNGPNWRKQKDPRGENAEYASRVLGGKAATAPSSETAATLDLDKTTRPGISTPMPYIAEKVKEVATDPKVLSLLASASFVAGSRLDPQKADVNAVFSKAAADDLARQEEIDNTGFIDTARSLFMHQGIVGGILKRSARGNYTPVPGYVAPEDRLAGRTADEQSYLMEATSPQEFDRLEWELNNEREDMRKAGLNGGWYALAAGVFAGLPEGVVTGVGMSKALAAAGMGSSAAMQGGQTGRAIGLNALENVGGNLLATGIEDAISGRMSLFDYAVAGSVGLVFTGASAHGIKKGSSAAAQELLALRIADEAAAKQRAVAEQASTNLGPDATPEELAREMDRLEVKSAKAELGTADAGEDRQLLPDLEKLEADEIAAEKAVDGPSADRATSNAVGMVYDSATNAPGQGKGILNLPSSIPKAGVANFYDDVVKPTFIQNNSKMVDNNGYGAGIGAREYFAKDYPGLNYDSLTSLPAGIHVRGTAVDNPLFTGKIAESLTWLQKQFASDFRIVLTDLKESPRHQNSNLTYGDAWVIGDKLAVIRVNSKTTKDWQDTVIHEFGHVLFNGIGARLKARGKSGAEAFEGFKQLHAEWQKLYTGEAVAPEVPGIPRALNTALRRGTVGSHYTKKAIGIKSPEGFVPTLMDVFAGVVSKVDDQIQKAGDIPYATKYIPNADEFAAEQFTKYIEAALAKELNWKPTSIPQSIVKFFKEIWDTFSNLFNKAKEHGLIKPDERAVAFFEAIRARSKAVATTSRREDAGLNPMRGRETYQTNSGLSQDVATKYGLDMMPRGTPTERAEHKALVALYTKADRPGAPWNNIDPKWVDTLTAKYPAIGSTGLQMLRSQNPVVRMVASELLESTTGAGGRRTTAAISKYMAERRYMGNTINEFQDAYKVWRNAQGGGIWEDYTGGKHWAEFNKNVAIEMEARNKGVSVESAPAVRKAADVLEAAYERMRIDQIDKKTVGWANLPASSKGYMPHRISGDSVRNMTLAQHRAWHTALVDQFVTIEGWDISFSANLAAKYIDRAKVRAMGGHEIPANVHHVGAADVVEDALTAMGMTRDEIRAQMAKFMRGGAGHTKARLKLDLLQEFNDGDNKFTLMDLFETDQLTLVRNQAQRVSGETALARHGIMGRSGLMLLRRGMADFGEDAGKAQPDEVQAFDQVAAEFLGQPFGDYGGKWMNRAMQLNSLARLGGMGFTQFAEYINAATHLGVTKAFSAISGLPRLRAEAAALARGEKVNNPIIGSIEVYGGAEFGTDAYKMVFPFDNPSLQYQVNGHDTVTLADRLLRGGSHAQGKLSFWRAIHGAQQRGVAEQIVHKAVKFIRDGGSDKTLADMGIDADLADALKLELPNIAKFDGTGRLQEFDITKAENRRAAEAFVQAVHRGTGQIIQGTFIGETGKWAHSGWLRLMTQFRTFSITSVEKQWARNRNNFGIAAALGMLMGSMTAAAPIYMARQYVNSLGREDQEEWLEKQLAPEKIARATLNYVAASGLAGDFLDAFAAITGVTEATGGRAGSTTEFVGTVIAPAAGLADDLWRSLQNSKDGTDVHEVVKNAPFAKLPWLAPVINLMDD